jgi:Rrf2 family protein
MLSKRTKYGLKALAYMARNRSDDELVQIRTIASDENIPYKFLESILLALKKAGFLGAKKGKGGGYYLLKEPAEMKMTDVIRTLEGPIAMLPCVSLNYYEKCDDCPDEETCSVHKLMIQVRDNTLEIFRNTTLEDLV